MIHQLPVMIAFLAGSVLLLLAAVIFFRGKTRRLPAPDELEGHEFEEYCARLLKKRGFTDVHVTQGSRDYGADILCMLDGITYAIQCKRYDHPVGIFAVQEVYAARDYYDRMVGVVMTNSVFTEPAEKMAEKLKILLWDCEILRDMEDNR